MSLDSLLVWLFIFVCLCLINFALIVSKDLLNVDGLCFSLGSCGQLVNTISYCLCYFSINSINFFLTGSH